MNINKYFSKEEKSFKVGENNSDLKNVSMY